MNQLEFAQGRRINSSNCGKWQTGLSLERGREGNVAMDRLKGRIYRENEILWKSFVDPKSRVNTIRELIANGLDKNDLETINGVMKAASIGIIPKDMEQSYELREVLLKKYFDESPNKRDLLFGEFKSLLREFPSNKKIMNRGPIRHGILGFKDHIVRGNDWRKLGVAGDFPRALHQLSHQIPAPELGHICKAYAQYLRAGGSIEAFDSYLNKNAVSFEEYFVKNAERIAGKGGEWCQISSERPKGIINVSDEDIRKAFSHRNWCSRSVDELMAIPGSKVATFFDVYGDTVIQTLAAQGITLLEEERVKEFLKPEVQKALSSLEQIRKRISDKHTDENWKYNEGYLQLTNTATYLRTAIREDIMKTKDEKKLATLLSFDISLESLVDNAGMNLLSRATKENGLMFVPEGKTCALLVDLLRNCGLNRAKYVEEINMLARDFHEAFIGKNKDSKIWAQKTMVPLNRLDRLVQRISGETSDTYRRISYKLASNNLSDNSAIGKVEQIADGILRGDMIFPVSQINSGFKFHLRKQAGASPWQILSAGEKAGMVIHGKTMEHIEEIIKKNHLSNDNLICFVDFLIGAEEPPKGVSAIITPKVIDTLSHMGVRTRQENIVFTCVDDVKLYEEFIKKFANKAEETYLNISVKEGNKIQMKVLTKEEYRATVDGKNERVIMPVKVILPKPDLSTRESIIGTDKIKLSVSGPKATNIARLANTVTIPESLDIPYAVFEKVIAAPENRKVAMEYHELCKTVDAEQKAEDSSQQKDLQRLKDLVNKLVFPVGIAQEIMRKVRETMPQGTRFVMTRSSTNGEDLANFSGAGLYSSQPNLLDNVLDGIKVSWASKWNKRAVDARVKAQIPHETLYVSVLIQPCIDTKYGFVTHTANPINKDRNEVFIELVQGQNEALVSGKIPGMGYGFLYNKLTGEVQRSHLADKSYRFVPADQGGTKFELADYKNDILAGDKHHWESTIRQIGEYSVRVERLYNDVPQDIEGCIKLQNDKVFIVQTRDQLGL